MLPCQPPCLPPCLPQDDIEVVGGGRLQREGGALPLPPHPIVPHELIPLGKMPGGITGTEIAKRAAGRWRAAETRRDESWWRVCPWPRGGGSAAGVADGRQDEEERKEGPATWCRKNNTRESAGRWLVIAHERYGGGWGRVFDSPVRPQHCIVSPLYVLREAGLFLQPTSAQKIHISCCSTGRRGCTEAETETGACS